MSFDARKMAVDIGELMLAQGMDVEHGFTREWTDVLGSMGGPPGRPDLSIVVILESAGDVWLFSLRVVAGGNPGVSEDLTDHRELCNRIVEECRWSRGRLAERARVEHERKRSKAEAARAMMPAGGVLLGMELPGAFSSVLRRRADEEALNFLAEAGRPHRDRFESLSALATEASAMVQDRMLYGHSVTRGGARQDPRTINMGEEGRLEGVTFEEEE